MILLKQIYQLQFGGYINIFKNIKKIKQYFNQPKIKKQLKKLFSHIIRIKDLNYKV